jgi:steroid delta-isomerase-like uncharacterized protein
MATDEFIRKQTAAFNQHNAAMVAEGYAANAIVLDPQYPEPLTGRDAISKDMADFFSAFPDITIQVTRAIAQGDTYAYEGTLNGTHDGPMLGPTGLIPATNRKIEVGVGVFGRLDARGTVVEEHRYYDLAGMLAQLGLME